MTVVLHLAEHLDLPAEEFIEAKAAFIGKSGRGKSGAVKVLMEELVRADLPFVAFDPVGIMWGIRSSLDGTGPGLPVLVIGGEHGDLPLDRKAGAKTADLVVRENVSCIIDFSEEPKAAYREFIRDFAHEVFRRNDTPRIIILEESPELVPQRMRPDLAETFEAVERLVSRGRNKGLGVVLVSQRAATINKDVLTQVDSLFVFGLTAPQDRKALGDWIDAWDLKSQAGKFDQGLASLHVREAWFWAPESFGGVFRKVKIRPFETFHPDRTHLRRTGLLKVRPVMVDVAGLVARVKGEKPGKEGDVDEKERKQYEEQIKRLEGERERTRKSVADIESGWRSRVEHLEKQLKVEHDRAEANAKVAAANAVEKIRRTAPTARQLAAALGTPEGEKALDAAAEAIERIDLHVERLAPNLTVHEKVVHVEATGEDLKGRIALLIAEGFFDQERTQGGVAWEARSRGWGRFDSGTQFNRLRDQLAEFCEWGFFRLEGKQYTLTPEAKERVKVVREAVTA